MPEVSLISALLVGLLGGTHCVGMCGGIVGALSLQMPANVPQWRFHLAYNLGRIASYGAAGVLVGAAGASSMMLSDMLPVKQALYLVANLLLVFLGLYLAGLSHAVVQLERLGGVIWQRLQPYSKKLLPVRSVPQAFALGALWGWVPCGLVYSVLVAAMASGSAAYWRNDHACVRPRHVAQPAGDGLFRPAAEKLHAAQGGTPRRRAAGGGLRRAGLYRLAVA